MEAFVTTEWMRLESGERMLSICIHGIPLFLPNEWLLRSFQNTDSMKTAQTYAQRLVIFFRWLHREGIALENATPAHLSRFQSALNAPSDHPDYLFTKENISEATRYQTLACAIRFLEWAMQLNEDAPMLQSNTNRVQIQHRGMLRGIVQRDFKFVRNKLLKRRKRILPRFIKEDDIERIRLWMDERWADQQELRIRNRAIFELLLDSGMRRGELLAIRLEDLDDDSGSIHIPYLPEEYQKARITGKPAAFQKTGERVVAIGSLAIQLLNEYITLYRPREAIRYGHHRLFCTHKAPRKGQPMTQHALQHLFDLINRPASEGGCGITQHVHPHITRHTFATRARRRGADSRAVQEQLGHRDPKTTQVYDAFVPELRRPLIDDTRVSAKELKEWGIDE